MTKKETAMRDWIKDQHPQKLAVFELCQQLGDIETEHAWCYFKEGRYAEDLAAEEPSAFLSVFSNKQVGYRMADQRVPYPSEEELLKHVTALNVSGEDLKKDKWTLLAEAYIHGK
jgi:hypothetical protein